MNGWGGLALNPNIGMAGMNMPYMTPPGGMEVLSPMSSTSMTPLNTFAPSVMPPGGAGAGGWFGIDGLGKNLGTMQLGIGALGGLANIWQGFQQNKLANKAFNHQKGLLDTNLANQIKSFNLQLDDKLRSRQVMEGTSDASREEARKRWEARDERRG